MKERLLLVALIGAAAVAIVIVPRYSPKAAAESDARVDARLVSADNTFGIKLFRELVSAGKGENVFISPASVAMALAMTYNGASGGTKEAMARALELKGMSLEQINKANSALLANFEGPGPGVELSVANSLWARKGAEFRADFLSRNDEFYRAEARALGFASPDALDIINGWVREKTNGRIDNIIKEISNETMMFLINAVYFKGTWQEQFDKARTRDGEFTLSDGTKKTVPMMSRHGDLQVLIEPGFQAVMLPYGKGRLAMYIFLPDRDSSLEAFHKALTPANWQKWMAGFHEVEGDLVMPRFRLEY